MMLKLFILITFATASVITDPCAGLCEAFSADRRGRGFDLCEGGTSACMESSEFCAQLFWALTDTGDRGLVFGNDIFADEVIGRVSCLEAETIVNIHFNPRAHVGFAIVSNFRFFPQIQNGLESTFFREEITRGGPFRYSTVSRINHSLIPRGELSLTMEDEIIELATLFGIRMVPEIPRYRRCLDCGTMFVQQSSERISLDARENTTLVELLNNQFGISRLVIGFCPNCRVRGQIAVRHSLSDPPGQVVSIRINRVEESVVTIPAQLDVSHLVYPAAPLGSLIYRLIAQTYTGVRARADVEIDGLWYRVNATHASLIGDMQISDYDWFFYERVSSN